MGEKCLQEEEEKVDKNSVLRKSEKMDKQDKLFRSKNFFHMIESSYSKTNFIL